jgi:hypothetical protein
MNCEDLRRYLHAVPTGDDPAARHHLAHCAHCRHDAADLLCLERSIEAAALSVEAPEGLASRVLLNEGRRRLHDGRDQGDGSLTSSSEKLI